MAATSPSVVALARELESMRAQLNDRTPQLQHSSIEVPAIEVDPETGEVIQTGETISVSVPEFAHTARTAESAADVANRVARDATAIARAKGRVIFSDEEPDVKDRDELTLWIDTSPLPDGRPSNTPRRWDEAAGKWAPVSDSQISIVQASATTALNEAARARALADELNGTQGEIVTRMGELTEEYLTLIAQLPNEILQQVQSQFVTRYYEDDGTGNPTEVNLQTLATRLSQTSEGFSFSISSTEERLAQVEGDSSLTAQTLAEQLTLIRLEADGIHIGREGDPVTVRLSNGSLDFYHEGNRIAWIDGASNTLQIRDARVNRSLAIGNEAWAPEDSGGISLVGA